MPDYELILWDKTKFNISSNVFVEEACEMKRWAFAADYIRIYALYTEGGVYLDTDVFARKKFDDFLQYDLFTSVEYHKGLAKIANAELLLNHDGTSKKRGTRIPGIGIQAAVLGGIKGHKFLEECLKYYDNKHFMLGNGEYFDQIIAPDTYAMVAEDYGFIYKDIKQNLAHNMMVFPSEIFAGHMEQATANSYAIHLCAGSWRNKKKEPLLKKIKMTFQENNIIRTLWGKKPIKEIIAYKLVADGIVTLEVFSESEIRLMTINLGLQQAGNFQFEWQPQELPAGRYICRIKQNDDMVSEQFFEKKYGSSTESVGKSSDSE